jgi:hypothetical protein
MAAMSKDRKYAAIILKYAAKASKYAKIAAKTKSHAKI